MAHYYNALSVTDIVPVGCQGYLNHTEVGLGKHSWQMWVLLGVSAHSELVQAVSLQGNAAHISASLAQKVIRRDSREAIEKITDLWKI